MSIEKPEHGLAVVPNGVAQRTAFGMDPVAIRTTGTVANAEASVAVIDVSRAAMIYLWCQFTIGSLTSVTLKPNFLLTKAGTVEFQPLTPVITAGSRAMSAISGSVTSFVFTAVGGNVIIPVVNPGAKWFELKILSVGTVTNSDMLIWYTLGWGNVNGLRA